MNKTQLQDDLIECNIENQKLRALLEEAIKIEETYDMEKFSTEMTYWANKVKKVLK